MADDQPTPERWRHVVGYEGLYEVSDHGRVRSVDRDILHSSGMVQHRRGKMLSLSRMRSGHLKAALSRSGETNRVYVHRLVMAAFVGPCPADMEVRHCNGDPANNHVSNLRYGERSENVLDMVEHGTHVQARKTHCAQGHPYSPENTRPVRGKWRECKTCRREAKARYLARKSSA